MTESTTPQLTESEVEKIDISVERYLADLVFGEPERGNRYVESLDQNIYFEENADPEFDAFDLLRQFPALIRDWKALRAERDEAIKTRDLYVSLKRGQQERADELYQRGLELLAEHADLRAQLAQARAENERLASQLKQWQEEKDAKAGYL